MNQIGLETWRCQTYRRRGYCIYCGVRLTADNTADLLTCKACYHVYVEAVVVMSKTPEGRKKLREYV